MVQSPSPDTLLRPLTGPARPVSQYLTMFHMLLVAVDPYTNESAWIIETAGRVLSTFSQADCRVGWLVTASPDEARAFLGPWADQFSTFADPDRDMIKGLGLARLPALVHLGMDGAVSGAAEGWRPHQWRDVADELARVLSWKAPGIPVAKDPAPYEGTPALG
ncbi:MAG: hypothetical protein ACYDH6_09580 [Acidimicrobiales bacterium]